MNTKTTGEILSDLRVRSGLTLAEVARAAGYKGPSSVQMMFSPDYTVHPLSPSVAARLAEALIGKGDPPIRAEEIFELTRTQHWSFEHSARSSIGHPDYGKPFTDAIATANEVQPVELPLPTLRGQPKDIPVYGSALAADLVFNDNGHAAPVEQTLFEMGEIITYARRPPAIPQETKVYALYVAGSSMEPRYRPGDPLFVDPRKPPAIGDDVVVQLVSADDEPQIIAGLIKTLVKRTGSYLELEQYRPEIRFRVPMERVAHIHRVIPQSELFGI